MATKKHAIIRTDMLEGTDVRSFISMGRYSDADGDAAAIENGNVVKIGDLIAGERDLRTYVAPEANTPLGQIGIVATPERFYDGLTHGLKDYINEAGTNLRTYLWDGATISSCFTVTEDGFDVADGTTPEIGWTAELMAGTKMKLVATATGGSTVVGKVIGVTKLDGINAYVIGRAV